MATTKTYWYMIPEDDKPKRKPIVVDSSLFTTAALAIAEADYKENGSDLPRYTIIFFESETGPEVCRIEVRIEMKPSFKFT